MSLKSNVVRPYPKGPQRMSRIAFFMVPAHGHINPTLPLVAELVRRGERVVYYSFECEAFRAAIERTGAELTTFSIGDLGVDPSTPQRGLLARGPVHFSSFLLEAAVSSLPRVLSTLEREPADLILHDSLCPWGRFAARILGLPAACTSSMFAFRRGVTPPMPLGTLVRTVLGAVPSLLRHGRAARQLRRLYNLDGLGVLSTLSNHSDLSIVFTSREFQPAAEKFDDSYRFVGPCFFENNEIGDFPLERLTGRRAIYVSLGTLFTQQLPFYRTCIEAFKDLGRPVVLAIFGNDEVIAGLGRLPENVIVRPFVPQLEVLERSALFLSHGGLNSVSQSLCEGVPLLLAPQMGEQTMIARRVASLGAGVVLRRRDLHPDALRARALEVLAEPRYAERAAAVGESLRSAGGPSRAADEVQRLKASRQNRASRPAAAARARSHFTSSGTASGAEQHFARSWSQEERTCSPTAGDVTQG
jgi:MGT family glycosyltransferase